MSSGMRVLLALLGCLAAVTVWVFVGESGGGGSARTEVAVEPSRAAAPVEGRPSSQPAEANRSREPTKADIKALVDIYNAEQELLVEAGKMDKLRKAGDLEACAEIMDELLPRAKKLDERASKLPYALVDMSTAANHMTRCVTCNQETAHFDCMEAKTLMKTVRDARPD